MIREQRAVGLSRFVVAGNLLRSLAVVVVALLSGVGCGAVDDRSYADSAGGIEEAQQAVTGCQLDCPGGQVFTCSAPCSVSGTSITCSGVTTTCPAACNTCASLGLDCGAASDGCGGTLNCGSCPSGQQCVAGGCEVACPSGKIDCCGDGVCRTPLVCFKIGC